MCLTTEIQSVHQPLHLVGKSLSDTVYEMKEIPSHRCLARTSEKPSAAAEKGMGDDYAFHTISIHKRRSAEQTCCITNIELNKRKSGVDAGDKPDSDVETSSITSVMDFEDDFVTRSVTWAQSSVVTEIRYRPKVTDVEKQALFYNAYDMQRFRLDAKIAKKLGRTQRLQSSQTSLHCKYDEMSYTEKTTPISGLIDMATNYLERLLSSQVNSSTTRDTSSNITENTNTLVETLYLF